MGKMKELLPYVVLTQALIMGAFNGFTVGTVFALAISAYMINGIEKRQAKMIEDRELILSELENYKKQTVELSRELTSELAALKNNIADMKVASPQKGTLNGQDQKPNPLAGRRF